MPNPAASALAAFMLLAATGCRQSEVGDAVDANVTVSNAVAPDEEPDSSEKARSPVRARIVLFAQGLDIVAPTGNRATFNFGGPMAAMLAELNKDIGAPQSDNVEGACGAIPTRIVTWPNGLRILSRNDRLEGWEIDRPGIYALGDLQVGMARGQLDANRAQFEQTPLGTQWSVGPDGQSVGGRLGQDGNVSAMWAGLTCQNT